VHASKSPTMTDPAARSIAGASALRCFLVEDSALIRQNLEATLEEMLGAQVVGSAEDETSAMAWVQDRTHQCDVMIIDIFLKSGSGLEVLRRARPLRPQTKLVVLSNYATADMRRRCLQLGADRVFDKSGELDELLAYCEGIGSGSPAH
jgi:DNA-binding NarL/FixJ family response regulator